MALTNRPYWIALLAMSLFLPLDLLGQNSVGINTDNPNPNAVLELVSPTNNQGLLIPRLTTTQRLGMQLSALENGLMVYDSDESRFYYWDNGAWHPLPAVRQLQNLVLEGKTLSLTDANSVDLSTLNTDQQTLTLTGTELQISGGNTADLSSLADDADADPGNEIQDLALEANLLKITNNSSATEINLNPYLDNTDAQTLTLTGSSLEISGGNMADLSSLIDDADADPSNEIQNISTDGSAGNLSISDGNSVTLNINDADADPANEIQSLSRAGSEITLSDGGGTVSVDDADADALNEIQDISTDGTAGNLSLSDGSTLSLNVNDADADPANEIQDIVAGEGISLTRTGNDYEIINASPDQTVVLADGGTGNVVIDGTYPNFTIDVPSLDDADADPLNEIQDLALTGNSLTVTNNAGATAIDLTSYLDNTDEQNLTLTGTTLEISGGNTADLSSLVNDADADPINEIQDISTDGTAGNLSLSSGSTIALNVDDADADPTNEIQDLNLSGDNLTVTNNAAATIIDLSPYLDNTDEQALTLTGTTLEISGGNTADLSSLVNDADFNPENEIQDLELTGDILKITNNSLASDIDLAPYLDNTDQQELTLTGTTLEISGGNTADLSSLVNDADADPVNELQSLSFTGSIIELSADPGATSIDLSNYDNDVTNDVLLSATPDAAGDISGSYSTGLIVDQVDGQTAAAVATATGIVNSNTNLDLDGTNDVLRNAIPDAAGDISGSYSTGLIVDEIDGQTAAAVATATSIVNGAPNLDLDSTDDFDGVFTSLTVVPVGLADGDDDNQSITKNGNSVELEDGGSFGISSGTPGIGQILRWDGTNWNAAAVADNSATNELQTLSFSPPNLTISGGNTVDLSAVGVLPAQNAGVAGYYLTTNGNVADWAPLGSLAQLGEVGSNEITNYSINADDINTSVAGDGLTGLGGTPLSINLSGTSGLQITTDQLELPNIHAGQTTFDGGTDYVIKSITVDSKGRVLSAQAQQVNSGSLGGILGLSDLRLKKDITRLDSTLQKALQLNAYNFYYKSDSSSSDLQTGVMAQEVEKVFPNLVVNRADGYLMVNYQGLIPILLEALKEEHQRVSSLESRLIEMESKAKAGEERLNELEEKLNLLLQASSATKTLPAGQE